MKILIGNKGNVDFDGPIKMTKEQKDEFIKYMKNQFSVIILEDREKFRTDRLGDKIFAKEWTFEEYKLLYEIENTDSICEKLGRSWMSVDIKRGEFFPEFLHWAHINSYDLVKEDVNKLIEEFFAEKDIEKKLRKENRKAELKKLKVLKKRQEFLTNKLRAIEFRIHCGQKFPGDEDRIANLNKELEKIEEKIR